MLRAQDFGNSSRILRLYTRDYGLLSVMARGVRGRIGRGTTTVASFATGELIAYVKPHRDLHTMKEFQCVSPRERLGRNVLRFAGACAIAELVLSHTRQAPQAGIYEALEDTLDGLERVPANALAATALSGLWIITEAFGFAPQVDSCVLCYAPVGVDEVGRFDFSAGGVRCACCSEDATGPRVGPIVRNQLKGMLVGDVPGELTYARRHLGLVSDFIAYHVVSRPLRSLSFLGRVLPPDAEVTVG